MKKTTLVLLVFFLIINANYCVIADQLELIDEWDTDFLIWDIEQDINNNYYLAGSNWDGAALNKYDNNKNLTYSKFLTESKLCYEAVCVSVVDENNIYVLGDDIENYLYDPGHNITHEVEENKLTHTHLVKLDSNGNILIDKDLTQTNDISYYFGMKIYEENIYVIGYEYQLVNYVRNEGVYDYYNYQRLISFAKLDMQGNIIKKIILGNKAVSEEIEFLNNTGHSYGGGYGSVCSKEYDMIFNEGKIYVYGSVLGQIYLSIYTTDLVEQKSLVFSDVGDINGILETNDGNFLAYGSVDIQTLDSNKDSKSCPIIIKYSPELEVIKYEVIEGRGEISAMKLKDDGYYALFYLREVNIPSFNNDKRGNYIARINDDFNIDDSCYLTGYWFGVFDLNEIGVSVVNNLGFIQHYGTNFDYPVQVENPDKGGELVLTEDREYYSGEEVSFSVQPDEGYELKEIQITEASGNTIELIDEDSFMMPSSEVTIKPVFKKINYSIFVVDKEETKEINFEIQDITRVEDKEIVNFNIKPMEGYLVESVEIVDEEENEVENSKVEEQENTFTFIMPESDVTITPMYAVLSYNVEKEEPEPTEDPEEKSTENSEDKTDDKKIGEIIEEVKTEIKTEISNVVEKIKNPSTDDKVVFGAFIGAAGFIIYLLVSAKRRKSSIKKSNILY